MDQLVVAWLEFSETRRQRLSTLKKPTPRTRDEVGDDDQSLRLCDGQNAGAPMDPRMLVSHNLSSYQPGGRLGQARGVGDNILAAERDDVMLGGTSTPSTHPMPSLGWTIRASNDATLGGAVPHV